MKTNNWKLKYQGQSTMYVYKDHTNIKNVLFYLNIINNLIFKEI